MVLTLLACNAFLLEKYNLNCVFKTHFYRFCVHTKMFLVFFSGTKNNIHYNLQLLYSLLLKITVIYIHKFKFVFLLNLNSFMKRSAAPNKYFSSTNSINLQLLKRKVVWCFSGLPTLCYPWTIKSTVLALNYSSRHSKMARVNRHHFSQAGCGVHGCPHELLHASRMWNDLSLLNKFYFYGWLPAV